MLARESRGSSDRNLFVQLITHSSDAACLQLAMTAVLGGELFHLLHETGAMAESQVVFYAACLTMALQHLHARGIAYRDLKTENVLLSGGFTHAAAGWPVLADFGLATWVKHDGSSLQTFCGTPAFLAPEVATQSGYGTAADWWSLGILIHQCLTLTTPFEGGHARETIENIIHGRRTHANSPWLVQRMAELSDGAIDILDALLHPDPAERLGGPLRGSEVVRLHPFFWGFEWLQIERRQMTHAARALPRARRRHHAHPSLRLLHCRASRPPGANAPCTREPPLPHPHPHPHPHPNPNPHPHPNATAPWTSLAPLPSLSEPDGRASSWPDSPPCRWSRWSRGSRHTPTTRRPNYCTSSEGVNARRLAVRCGMPAPPRHYSRRTHCILSRE